MPLKLNYHISIRNIDGEKDDDIAACYGQKCKDIPDAKKRRLCKEACQQAILRDTISKLSSLVGKCQYADHPSPCRQAVAKKIGVFRRRIETSKDRTRDIKAEMLVDKSIRGK